MIKRISILVLAILLFISSALRADEGMWIPLLLSKYNIADMQKKGFKLTAEDIYSINKASMKDAVMIFGGGCTAELISNQGLILTNHHCGYNNIQQHSSLEHDYLTDGFWAMNKNEELVNQTLTVTFLVRMEDVTKAVLEGITDNMDEQLREETIAKAIKKLESQAKEGTRYEAKIKPFFYGNEYYMFVTEIFKDVRLVGAPPSAIGKFGGDTDNWMWPRHTGDFSIFRIYANSNNEPAAYSPENVPYKPKKFFPISIKGVKKGDFTMVFGYPGSTQEYLPSYAVEMISKVENPHQIKIRQKKIDILTVDMNESADVRIKYSAKYASISNYWKKWIGENAGLQKLNAIERKREMEKKFTEWVNLDPARNQKYGGILPRYEEIYKFLSPYVLAEDYFYESVYSLDLMQFCSKLQGLTRLTNSSSQTEINAAIEKAKANSERFFKDYNLPTDKRIFSAMMKLYYDNLDVKFHPDLFNFKNALANPDKNASEVFDQFTNEIYSKSMLVNKAKVDTFLTKFSMNSLVQLKTDPAFLLFQDFLAKYSFIISPAVSSVESELNKLNRTYVAAQREWKKDKVFYPDANSTLRVSYGQVDDYFPRDGVHYLFYTTIDGIIEKDNPDIYDYKVPEKLKQLYKTKDYGPYAEKGQMHVCFIASNHTTGGNSGSPVINGKGELIGINFDRVWEGTMSDLMYDPNQCRNVTLDIRYVLFIVDKFAGASHLIKEMQIVK